MGKTTTPSVETEATVEAEVETPTVEELLEEVPSVDVPPADITADNMPLPVDGSITADPDHVVEVETVVNEDTGVAENIYADLDTLNKVPTAFSNPPSVVASAEEEE